MLSIAKALVWSVWNFKARGMAMVRGSSRMQSLRASISSNAGKTLEGNET